MTSGLAEVGIPGSIEHLSVAGMFVQITAPEINLSAPFTSFADYDIGLGRRQHFGAGTRTLGLDVAQQVFETELTESFSYQNGTLRLGRAPDFHHDLEDVVVGEFLTGVWEGSMFSVYTRIYDGTFDDLVALFDLFEIREHPSGVELHPTSLVRLASAPRLMKDLHRYGVLTTTPLDDTAAVGLPSHRGASCEGGEMFLRGTEVSNPDVVVVGTSSVTTVTPAHDGNLDDVVVLAGLLEVQWRTS